MENQPSTASCWRADGANRPRHVSLGMWLGMTVREIIAVLAQRDMDEEVRLEIRVHGESIRAWAVEGATYEKGCVYLWGTLSERKPTDGD